MKCVAILVEFIFLLCIHNVKTTTVKKLNIGIIGAGPAGLISAKESTAYGHNVTIYEQNDELGGVWVYTDQIGKNQYGINVHTAMYRGLRTNSPASQMEFPGYHHPKNVSSYPTQAEMLKYLHSYADHFDLNKFIKLHHQVIHVQPIENDKWEVTVKDLKINEFTTNVYDAVLVCNGHFFAPHFPSIDGINEFKGKIMHSHDFRKDEDFRGQNVLVIGMGRSGVDLANHLSKVAKRVTVSRNKPDHETKEQYKMIRKKISSKTILKENVKHFTNDGAEFIDGTQDFFDVIIYATGYSYSYPFLSVESGIHVDDNFVQPLFKHIFNIEHPTMAFIGIPVTFVSYFHLFDIQIRFAMKFLSEEKMLPTKYEMLENLRIESKKQWNEGYPKEKTHWLRNQHEYEMELCKLAEIHFE